jgi:streptogramin lyase
LDYPAKLQSLPGNPTRFAVEGQTLWIPAVQPTGENYLHRYDTATDTLTTVRLPSAPGGGWYVGIAADGLGAWIAWDQTLVRFDSATSRTLTFAVPTESDYQVSGVSGKWLLALAIGPDGHLWLTRRHAASVLELSPVTGSYNEHGLATFGVPDRIRFDSAGRLWMTVSRDAVTQREFTQVGLFDPVSQRTTIVPQHATDLTIDPQGDVLIGGNTLGITRLSSTGALVSRFASPFPATSDDLVRAMPNGTVVVANRMSNSAAVRDPLTGDWKLFPFQRRTATIHAPEGYTGSRTQQLTAEVTDLHVAGTDVYLLVASNMQFARLRP